MCDERGLIALIVVEGMDNTGKTTLVEQLQQEFPQLKYRPSIGNKHDLSVIRAQAQDEAYSPDKLSMTLGDRSRLISEYIYQPLLGKRDAAYSFDAYMEMIGFFARNHHLVIHCYRSTARIIDTWDEGQLEGVREHLSELSSQYDKVMHMLRFLFRVGGDRGKVITYSFEAQQEPQSPVFRAVRQYIHEEAK